MRCSRERAFTIVELMVVIAILAILAGILIPAAHRASRSRRPTAAVERVASRRPVGAAEQQPAPAGGAWLRGFAFGVVVTLVGVRLVRKIKGTAASTGPGRRRKRRAPPPAAEEAKEQPPA